MQYIAGFSISLFVAALLGNKKDKALSDKILLAWMLLNALHLFVHYAYTSGSIMDFPFLYGILAPLPLFHGVFLYFYVASMTDQMPVKKYSYLFHAIPAFLFYIYLLLFFFFIPKIEQIKVLQSKGADHPFYVNALALTTMLSGVIYIIWSILLLGRHKRNILDSFSGLEKVNLRWLWFLILGLGILWAVVIVSNKDEHIYSVAVGFIILTGYFGLQQIDIYNSRDKDRVTKSIPEQKEKYAKSGLSENASSDLFSELISLMEEKSVFKQQELSISDLASMLDTHPNYLSQVINDKAEKKFFDFINTYRVEAFKEMIADPDNGQFTWLSLAYECGFNSKSSFNRYFKKATGYTPTQYANTLKTA